MAADTVIANLAISHLGVGKQIADLQSKTEQSEEARTMRQFYDQAVKQTLRDFAWPFATITITLGLVATAPTNEWKFAYRKPSDSARLIRIPSGFRNETNKDRIPYRVIGDGAGGELIYTDMPNAQLEYVQKITDPSVFPDDFIMAASFRLAMYGAPRITSGDNFNVQQRLSQFYLAEISAARANVVNEEQSDVAPESDFITTRDGISNRDGRLIPL